MEIFPSLTLQLDIFKVSFYKSGVPVRVQALAATDSSTHTRRHRDRSRRPCIFVYSKQMHFISTPHDGDGQRNYRPFAPFLHLEINHPIKRRLRYCFCIFINIGHYFIVTNSHKCFLFVINAMCTFWYC